MAWHLAITDRSGSIRDLLAAHDGFNITQRLDADAGLHVEIDARSRAAGELAVAERCVKAYQDGTLRFAGQVWEPLTFNQERATVEAKDALAVFRRRRVREEITYVTTDAGDIVADLLTLQNGYEPTGLRIGNVSASVVRDRTYLPGKLIGEILDDLADASDGFFYRAIPVEDEGIVTARLDIFYPDAGTTREDKRFEYGEETAANLNGYEIARQLPLNRVIVASSAIDGGRIARASINADSRSRFGLFEEEFVYSDTDDVVLLAEHAAASVRANPPRTVALTPGPNAPLLFHDFEVGDFVRLWIKHASIDLLTWVRVLEATLNVSPNGVETLSSIVVETLTGGKPSDGHDPQDFFRRHLDADRRRIESLERRVSSFEQVAAASPSAPSEDPGDDTAPPADPVEPTVPPGAPPAPPSLANLSASSPGFGSINASVDANGNGTATSVFFTVVGVGSSGAQSIGTGFAGVGASFSGLTSATYSVTATAQSDGGTVTIGPVNVFVPPSGPI